MNHVPYPKIVHLDKDEAEGILDGEVVVIQEKIDGANLSVWKTDEGLYVGSRTQIVGTPTQLSGFRWAVEYVNAHEGIKKLLAKYPNFRLFGEWLVPHTVKYPDKFYNKFWLFDILDESTGEWMHPVDVARIAKDYWIHYPKVFFFGNANRDKVSEFVGKSELEVAGEGVVVKRFGWKNKFGEHKYAKLVSDSFKERNQLVFGNTHKDSMPELDFACYTVTVPRIVKLVHKMEQDKDKDADKSFTGELIGRVYHDAFTEELWDYVKKNRVKNFDFQKAEKYCMDRTKVLFFDYLDGFKSVANSHEYEKH